MMDKLKVLGLALVAVCVISAVVASAASALTGEIEVEGGGEATITGEQISGLVTGVEFTKDQLTTDIGAIKCSPANYHGVAKNGSKELTLTAAIGNTVAGTGCTVAGIAGPIIHFNGCDYLYTLAVQEGAVTADVHLICPPETVIDTTISGCTVTIAAQTLKGITIVNAGGAGSAMDVRAVVDITGIDYVEHSIAPGTCPNGGGNTTTKTNGTFKGVVTLKGEAVGGGAAKGVTVK